MRPAIFMLTLFALSSCATPHLGPQKPPEYFVTPSVLYLAEAKGKFPEVVKKAVLPSLQRATGVERAYLVSIKYPDGASGTCLCLTPSTAESMEIAESVGEAYGVVAKQGVYLDIMFINEESLRSVDEVAKPFYVRP
jgi:hypothetical protein